MRLLFIALVLFSAGSIVAAAYTSKTVENYLAYANVESRTYAHGDAGDPSGWRDCTEMVNTGNEIGLVCEGVRTILVHGGKSVDVNYFVNTASRSSTRTNLRSRWKCVSS